MDSAGKGMGVVDDFLNKIKSFIFKPNKEPINNIIR